MIHFDVHNRFTRKVQFTAEIDCTEDAPRSVKLRHAILWAIENDADLNGTSLRDADLSGIDLRNADLSDTDLRDVNFCGANLNDSDFRGTDLRRANFIGANLRGANFHGVKLHNINLCGAKLRSAIWTNGAVIRRKPIIIDGLRYRVIILDAHAQIGCQIKSLHEWEEVDEGNLSSIEDDAIDFWLVWRDVLLAMASANDRDFRPQEDLSK